MSFPTETDTDGGSGADTGPDAAQHRRGGPATISTAGEPIRVVRGDEVGAVLRRAAVEGHGVTPRSSTGPARHRRSTPRGGARQLDLSALRDIVLVSERQRVAIVEAGVTWAQLDARLADAGLRVNHPLLPPAGKSVVASLLDREPPLSPRHQWDFTDPLLCAELWFGTGDRFRTGSSAGPGATLEDQWRAGMYQKNPLGPAQTDLVKLAQGARGSMGIATWASIRVEHRPALHRWLTATASDLGAVARLVSAVTRRRIGEEIVVFDAVQRTRLAEALGVGEPGDGDGATDAWWLGLRIGSLRRQPERSLDYQVTEARSLAEDAGVTLVDVTGGADEAFCESAVGVLAPGADWKRTATGHTAQVEFLTTADRAGPLVEVVRAAWAGVVGGDAVGAYVQPLNQGRAAHVEVTAWPTASQQAALEVGAAGLARELADRGAFFSRPIGAAVAVAYERCPDVVATLRKVKAVLDPDGVLSPGVLCFGDGDGTAGPGGRIETTEDAA